MNKEQEAKESFWWCPNCQEEKAPQRVTYQERCADCGYAVIAKDILDNLKPKGYRLPKQFTAIDDEAICKSCNRYSECVTASYDCLILPLKRETAQAQVQHDNEEHYAKL